LAGTIEFNGDSVDLGTVDEPGEIIVNWFTIALQAQLPNYRRSLRVYIVGIFLPRITGGVFGPLSDLLQYCQEGLHIHDVTDTGVDFWRGKLLAAVIREVFLAKRGAFSIYHFLYTRNVPQNVVCLASICVCFPFLTHKHLSL
jgi:hypothetical protein